MSRKKRCLGDVKVWWCKSRWQWEGEGKRGGGGGKFQFIGAGACRNYFGSVPEPHMHLPHST